MTADEIQKCQEATVRNAATEGTPNLTIAVYEVARQLAEMNVLLRSLIETNGKAEGKLRVRTLQY